jgi:WD40 repeat protein
MDDTGGDLLLGDSDRRRLRDELANLYPNSSAASRLLVDIGFARNRHPLWENAANPAGWWAAVFVEFDRGVAEAPYRRLLVTALAEYPSNGVLREIAWRHRVITVPGPGHTTADAGRGTVPPVDPPGDPSGGDAREPGAPADAPLPGAGVLRGSRRRLLIAAGSVVAAAAVPVVYALTTGGTDEGADAPGATDSGAPPSPPVRQSPAGPAGGFAGREPAALGGHSGAVTAAAFSPDSTLLATGGDDGEIIVREARHPDTGGLRRFTGGHFKWVHGLAFSPGGNLLASAAQDDTVQIWDVASRRVVQSLRGNEDAVYWVGFIQDDRTVASAGEDGTVRVWDLSSPQTSGLRVDTGAPLTAAAVQPGRARLVTVGKPPPGKAVGGLVSLWDARDGTMVGRSGEAGWLTCVDFSPDGTMIATGQHSDGPVLLWLVGDGGVTAAGELKGHVGGVLALAFAPDPDGGTLVTGGYDRTVRVWSSATGPAARSMPLTDPADQAAGGTTVREITISPDGRSLLVAGEQPGARLWSRP